MRLKATLVLTMLAGILPVLKAQDAAVYKEWGTETLKMIDRDYWLERPGLYSEFAVDENGKRSHPSFMWGVGVQLSALVAAAELEPDTYLEKTKAYADSIQSYWTKHKDIEGFDVQPRQKEADRYYDDNAWLVLALAEVYELTKDQKYLDRAIATYKFVVSCEDEKLDGGLYWRENFLTSKNTCTNAPAIASALRLHQLTKEPQYLETAQRLYKWVNSKLQDTDGLYWDNIQMDGKIDRRKYTYNSALMIRSNCLFAEITGDKKYLEEAKRIAASAEKEWVRGNGAIADSGRFAHLLLESFLSIHEQDKDPRWVELTSRTLKFVHENLRQENGRYPNRWDRAGRPGRNATEILNQASPARAYWMAAAISKKP